MAVIHWERGQVQTLETERAGVHRYLLNTTTMLTRSQSNEGNSRGNSGVDLTMVHSPHGEKTTILYLVLMW